MTSGTRNGNHAVTWARDFMLLESDPMPEVVTRVKGHDFNEGASYEKIVQSFKTVGFQANHFSRAVEEINQMIDRKFQATPPVTDSSFHGSHIHPGRPTTNCTIMLGYTSNMVTSGNREVIRYLVQHNMVDCIVATAGGIEEDFMKCMDKFCIGDFEMKAVDLLSKNHHRAGNILMGNSAYSKLHRWLDPILESMVHEQKNGMEWTPSKFIRRLGKEINNEESIYYWAYKNNIPVFSPAVTDGAIGDALFYHRHQHPHDAIKLDLVEDVQAIDDLALYSVNTGALVLGAGLVKHHILNANCIREGAEHAVFINTSSEFDGSDSGARPDEAVTWSKIKAQAKPVKVCADATLILPLLVAETFAKREAEFKAFYSKQPSA